MLPFGLWDTNDQVLSPFLLVLYAYSRLGNFHLVNQFDFPQNNHQKRLTLCKQTFQKNDRHYLYQPLI
jgi:hypothetical protein